MLFYKAVACLTLLASVVACPLVIPNLQKDEVFARDTKPPPAKPAPHNKPAVVLYDPANSVVEQARKANYAPGRIAPKQCKQVYECTCPKTAKSTACIKGWCECDNPGITQVGGFFAKTILEGFAKIGNAPIMKAMEHLMKGIADIKQVVSIIAGQFLPLPARIAFKAALNVIPDTGPSHIDDATKGILMKAVGPI
ncbi:hypothetical protein H0H87_004917 [Tephrocybe sp. NHM501043]|nr:hypothetical protein H0H87_004917 [Tephrocybe sp. NHM501043]